MPRRIRPAAGRNHQCHPGSRDIRLEDVKVQAHPLFQEDQHRVPKPGDFLFVCLLELNNQMDLSILRTSCCRTHFPQGGRSKPDTETFRCGAPDSGMPEGVLPLLRSQLVRLSLHCRLCQSMPRKDSYHGVGARSLKLNVRSLQRDGIQSLEELAKDLKCAVLESMMSCRKFQDQRFDLVFTYYLWLAYCGRGVSDIVFQPDKLYQQSNLSIFVDLALLGGFSVT